MGRLDKGGARSKRGNNIMRATHYFITGAVGATVIFTGCKKTNTVVAESGLLSSATIKTQVLDNQIKAEDVDADKAQAALDFLKAEGIGWASVSGENGHYKFKQVSFEDEDASIDSLEVSGLQMYDDETPYVRSISLQGLESEDVEIKAMSFNLPSLEQVKALAALEDEKDESKQIQAFSKLSSEMMMGFGNYDGGGFLEGLTIKDADLNGNIGFMGWSKEAENMSMLLEDMKFSGDNADEKAIGRIGHISVKNIKVSNDGSGSKDGLGAIMGAYMSILNPYKRGYESMAIRDVEFSGSEDDMSFSFTLPKGDVWFTEPKNGVFHLKTDIPKMQVKFDLPEGELPDEQMAMIKDYGFDNLEFRMWGDTRVDAKNDNLKLLTGGFAWADNFEINMSYDTDGMSKYYEATENMFGDIMPLIEEVASSETEVDPAELEARIDSVFEQDMMAMMESVVLHELVVELRDKSLFDKVFKIAAEMQDQEVADLKNGIKAMVTMSTSAAPTETMTTLAKDFMSSAHGMIDDGGTIRIIIKPANEMSFKDMMDGFEAMEAGGADPVQTMTFIDDVIKDLNIDFEHVPN